MKNIKAAESRKGKIIMFIWQHILLCLSLFIMTLGVTLSVRSNLGSSVISTIPFIMSLAGQEKSVPSLTIGEYTYCLNFLLVGLQILVLRKRFDPMQLFQILVGFLFGFLLDVNMWLTRALTCDSLVSQIIVQLLGCTVLAIGISVEIKCGSVTMPGEGFPVALSKVFNIPFPKAKIIVDVSLVTIAVILGFCFFGSWLWNVVGPGTLLAMVLVGAIVRFINPHMNWFDRILYYRPGLRRYIFGLARFIHRND